MQKTISTDRLSLDIVTTADHDFMQALVNSPGWLEFIGDRNVHSAEDAIAYINKINNMPDVTYWVARTKNDCEPIGVISFIKRGYLDYFDIGFAFLPRFIGGGYAFEAAKTILALAGRNPLHKTLLATTIPGNTKSIRLLTKLGFSFYKELRIENELLHVYSNATENNTIE